MRIVYLILVCFAAPVAALIAQLRGLQDSSRRERLADRFGRPALAKISPVIWVHAASMGEVQAGAILVRKLLADYPDHEFVMTTMTATGAARVRSLFPDRVTHCFLPYDLPFAVKGFLDRVRPHLGIVMETELWPTLLRECGRRRIPIVVASARISPRTAASYRRFADLFREALKGVEVAAQTTVDAERFRDAGASRVAVTGNVKFDIEIPSSVLAVGAALRAQIGERFVWVAGSTHDGEERAVLDAHRELVRQKSDAFLILAPRHPQRFDEVRTWLQKQGAPFVSRTDEGPISKDTAILLMDTMGELLSCYAAANLAFVGGSMVPVGGHNVLEPAALNVPVICGPHMTSAQDVFDRLNDAEGILQIFTPEELRNEVVRLASDPARRQRLSANASHVLNENRGATAAVLALLQPHLSRAEMARSLV